MNIARLIPVFVLLAFTNPAGQPLYVDSASVAAVAGGSGYCEHAMGKPSAFTRIDVGQGSYCVRESADEVVRAINAAGEEAAE